MGHLQISLCKYKETHLTDELTNTKKLDECLESKQIINYSEKNPKAFVPFNCYLLNSMRDQ